MPNEPEIAMTISDAGIAIGDVEDATGPSITVEDMSVERGGHVALTGITFDVGPGTLMGILGPNGAGKSTLFEAVAGLLPVASGSLTVRGIERKGALAYVPQRDSINWRFPATIQDVVMMGRGNNIGWFQRPSRQDKEMVRDCLERVNLWDERTALVDRLSGGQRQRVFIARALAQEASIILMDEAFSGVDVAAQEDIIVVLQSLRDEGKIVIISTHDLTNIAERFDRILCINHHMCAYGPPEEAFTPEVLEELFGSHGLEFTHHHTDPHDQDEHEGHAH